MELVLENPMSDQSVLPEGAEDKEISIEGRFGEVKVKLSKALYFANGILGFEEAKGFALTEFPTPKMNEHFRLLQSLDDAGLSFITRPLSIDNTIFDRSDLEKIAEEIGAAPDTMIIALIASPTKVNGVMQVTVNAKAPIIIDAESRMACQYVFSHDKYDMKHDITALIAGAAAA